MIAGKPGCCSEAPGCYRAHIDAIRSRKLRSAGSVSWLLALGGDPWDVG